MMNDGGRCSNISYNNTNVAGLNQSPDQSSSMHVELTGHDICPHFKKSLARSQGLESDLNNELGLQQQANQEGRIAVLATPAPTTAPKSITNQEVIGHTQTAQGKEIQETGKQERVAMEDQKSVLPLFFVNSATHNHEPRVTRVDLDWSWEGHSYAAPSNLHIEQLDPETAVPETHQGEEYPHFFDFMNILKHGKEMTSSSSTKKIVNSELMELRQSEEGHDVSTVNTNLTLNHDGIDLTLRL